MSLEKIIERIQKSIIIILTITFASSFLALIIVTQKQSSDSSQSDHIFLTTP